MVIETLNTKSETLNKFKIQMIKIFNGFEYCDLEFWICLGFRVSDLGFKKYG